MDATSKQLTPLTGLRGVAAYSVLIAHSISVSFLYGKANLMQPLGTRLAYFGMSLFFVLSGFVIHYNYAKLIRSAGQLQGGYQFLVARFARLFPLYALVLFFSMDHIPSITWSAGGLFACFTMTQSWVALHKTLFAPAWSISAEWFFYLAFIIFAPLLDRIRRPATAFRSFLMITFVVLFVVFQFKKKILSALTPLLWQGNVSTDWVEIYERWDWITYFSPYTRIFEFIAGVLASQVYLSKQGANQNLTWLNSFCMFLCVGWCVALIIFGPEKGRLAHSLMPNFMYAPAIAPLLVLCCRFDTVLSRVLSSRPLIFIGEISYSLYLLQFLIMTGLGAAYVSTEVSSIGYLNSSIKVIVILTFTTFIAYGSYNLFEKPARKYLRNLLTGKSHQKYNDAVPETVPGV